MSEMTPYEQFYVYAYLEENNDIVYIGKGCKGRAWHMGYMKGDTQERHDWKEEQVNNGRLPCDYVFIMARGLTHEDALILERELIQEHEPKFNKLNNPSYSRTDTDLIERAKQLRETGLSYEKIGKEMKKAAMTVYRWINDK